MNTPNSVASCVVERFPDFRPIIVELYAQNEDFRELCDHFAECLGVLANLKSSFRSEQNRIDEYQTLIDELADEIRTTVAAAV